MTDLSQLLDLTLLDGYKESLGDVVLDKMLSMYREQSIIYLREIEQSIGSESQSDWHACCHKMKGAAASTGLKVLRAHLAEIEKQEQTPSWKLEQLEMVKVHSDEGIKAFEQWLSV